MVQLVRYFSLPTGKVVDRHAGIVVVFGPWPERVLKHRGYTEERRVYTRVATVQEHEWLADCMRLQAFSYPSREALLEDEKRLLDQSSYQSLERALQVMTPA